MEVVDTPKGIGPLRRYRCRFYDEDGYVEARQVTGPSLVEWRDDTGRVWLLQPGGFVIEYELAGVAYHWTMPYHDFLDRYVPEEGGL